MVIKHGLLLIFVRSTEHHLLSVAFLFYLFFARNVGSIRPHLIFVFGPYPTELFT